MNDKLLKAISEHLGYDVKEVEDKRKGIKEVKVGYWATELTVGNFEYSIVSLTDGNSLIRRKPIPDWTYIGIVGAK